MSYKDYNKESKDFLINLLSDNCTMIAGDIKMEFSHNGAKVSFFLKKY